MGRRAVLLVLSLLVVFIVAGVLAPAALASRMNVPVWKQGDSRWATQHLGTSSYSMAGSGCAITASAMVAAYYGSTKDPGRLCRALGADGGLDPEGNLYWGSVPGDSGAFMSYIGGYDYCWLTRINKELDSGNPVIVKLIHNGGKTHFVVLTGRDGSIYYMNDPAYGDRTTLNARYGAPSEVIRGFRVYHAVYIRSEQANDGLAYSGDWTVSQAGAASADSFRFAGAKGASLTITFRGTYLAWIAKKSPVYGIAKVSVDGKAPVAVDLYSRQTLWRQKVWATGILSAGTHTVRIYWTGNKNAAATATNIGVDAFDIVGSVVARH